MQQFVPRHLYIGWPLGEGFGKTFGVATMKHPPSQMIWGFWFVFHSAYWTQVRGIAHIEAETAHTGPRLHDIHARWRFLYPIKGSHCVAEEKLNFWKQPRSQSNREPVD